MSRKSQSAGAAWERQVMELAKMYGWRVASFRSVLITRKDGSKHYATPVSGDAEGWPDLVLVRDDVILFRELKTEKATVTSRQRDWHDALREANCDVHIWRPIHLENTIIPTLSRRS